MYGSTGITACMCVLFWGCSIAHAMNEAILALAGPEGAHLEVVERP